MQARKLLQNLIGKSCSIHKKRLEVLLIASETLVSCCRLSITGLGRGLVNHCKPKHNINRMDRLVGNRHLYNESLDIQRTMTKLMLGHKKDPCILVDWSSATIAERYQVLRASVAVEGRSLTVYEEIHPLKKYNKPEVHRCFLENLSKVLPKTSRPIIVTDAGFGIPWFKEVEKLGWDFLGRLINKSYYTKDGKRWYSVVDLLKYRKEVIRRLGKVLLSKSKHFECYLQANKEAYKGRKKKNVYGEKARRSVSLKNEKSARQAWVLAHSLGDSDSIGRRVVKLYKSRMQIEESFRDIKSPRYGFGLRYSGTLGIKRLTNLFLIGLIGTMLAWLMGLSAKDKGLHYGFQTNSIKHRNVLSVFYIGCQMAKRSIRFKKTELLQSLRQIQELIDGY